MEATAIGTILFYLADKRYGYLRLEGTREEFHFRAADLAFSDPKAGDLVRFTILENRKGIFAKNIQRAGIT